MKGLDDDSDYRSSSEIMESPKFKRSKGDENSGTTKDRVKKMSDQAGQMNRTLQSIMDKFQNFESKLKDLSIEHQKQRTINDHLLSQLVQSKEKE